MTNGEKIQTILDIDKDCTEVYGKNGMMTFSVPQDWWNAEYKEPVIRDNGVKNELNRVKNELGVASGLEKNSKLEKIRAEIKAKQDAIFYGFDHYDDGVMDGLDCALELIEQAEAESI